MLPPQANFIRKATVCLHSFISICADSETVGMVIDMKKKVTDLSQALAVGLPVPASAAGETFSDVPAPPWAVPAAPEWKNGGKAAPSDPYLVPPL